MILAWPVRKMKKKMPAKQQRMWVTAFLLPPLCLPFPLLLDGPMGTELERRGVNTSQPIWSARALIDSPGLVEQIPMRGAP